MGAIDDACGALSEAGLAVLLLLEKGDETGPQEDKRIAQSKRVNPNFMYSILSALPKVFGMEVQNMDISGRFLMLKMSPEAKK